MSMKDFCLFIQNGLSKVILQPPTHLKWIND